MIINFPFRSACAIFLLAPKDCSVSGTDKNSYIEPSLKIILYDNFLKFLLYLRCRREKTANKEAFLIYPLSEIANFNNRGIKFINAHL